MVWRVRCALDFFHLWGDIFKPCPSLDYDACRQSPILSYGVCDDLLTGLAGLPAIAALARILGLPWLLQKYVQIKVRQRGSSDARNLLSLIFALCTGGGHLNAVDALAADEAACEGAGLQGTVPNSRRLGEYLARFSAKALNGLQACVRAVSAQVVPPIAAACGKELGYVPVFIDGTGIEVQGKHFEGAAVGYNGERQYWLHSVFVGRAWVSARLNEGGTDVKGDFAEQLAADVDALDLGPYPVWARADAAYYCEAFVKECAQRGWDYSVSVTDPNKKAPVLRIVEEMELDPKYWEPLDAQGVECAVTVTYRPGTWEKEQVYVVIRRDRDGEQELLQLAYTMILVSRDDLRVGELVRRHRAKQGSGERVQGPADGAGAAPSAVPVVRGEPSVLLVRADRAVAAADAAIPSAAGGGAGARSGAADPVFRAQRGADAEARSRPEAAVREVQLPLEVAAAGGAHRTRLSGGGGSRRNGAFTEPGQLTGESAGRSVPAWRDSVPAGSPRGLGGPPSHRLASRGDQLRSPKRMETGLSTP